MNITSIFTAEELTLIDSGKYTPGRTVLDAKLDLAAALEREACAKLIEAMRADTPMGNQPRTEALFHAAKNIRARGQE